MEPHLQSDVLARLEKEPALADKVRELVLVASKRSRSKSSAAAGSSAASPTTRSKLF